MPDLRLPPTAHRPLQDGETYAPVVSAGEAPPELTVRSILTGVVVGIVFGAANAYLGLKVGLTVSASIPAAVIAIAIFRLMRRPSLLETNLVQTIGSSGESLAAGVIFTLPVLFLWDLAPGFWPVFPLALLGGLLGVLFMIPLRRYLIEQQHGHLAYPEGTACAQVQVASVAGGAQGALLFVGMLVGAGYTVLEKVFNLFPAEPDLKIDGPGFRTSVGADVTPELLGVGYIIGPRVAAVMLAGGALGWLVLIPLIYLFGGAATSPVPPEAEKLVADMDSFEIWSRYVRYIGAGAVAFGGLATLVKSLPTMVKSFRLALSALRGGSEGEVARTQREVPLSAVGIGLLLIFGVVSFAPLMTGGGSLGLLAGLAVVVFSFFFVTVSSRIVGLIGSSSNPISGMTIATVLLCALLFGGWFQGDAAKIAVLTIGALVCMAAAVAGDTSQDLKTGYLLGATPRRQQVGEIIGVATSALVMSSVLTLFRDDVVSGAFKAPQANLIRLVIDGVLGGDLPWGLVLTGMAIAACVELVGLPTLAFAVGLYLPVHLAVPIMSGGLIRLVVQRRHAASQADASASPEERAASEESEAGVLFASGLIAGAALLGVLLAALAFFSLDLSLGEARLPEEWLRALIAFGALAGALAFVALRRGQPRS